MSKQTYVIVGASLAGAKAAQELRDRGFDGRVVMVGAEPERPYERPPLSKDHLRGESERDKAFVHEQAFYEQHGIELITGLRVTALELPSSQVSLEDGRTLRYDKLLLTTGAEPRRLSVPGAELDGIHYLRTLEDCEALRGRIKGGGRLAVVGAGWIGSEVAASARQMGADVTLIDPLALPNERIFGPEIGSFYRDVQAQHGVELALGDGVEAFEGDGRINGVRTSSGRVVDCDFAVVGAMLGEQVSYDRIPYFFSDQYDVGMEYSGFATEWDEVVFRGDRDAGEFIAFWLEDERVVAGMNVNV